MGKVFRSEHILEGRYPELGDQFNVAQSFIEQATALPDLHAAITFGSTAIGNPRRRSDVDLALAYDSDHPGQIADFHFALEELVQGMPLGQLVEPHIISRLSLEDPKQAQKGDVLLTEHLRLVAIESAVPGINEEAFATMADPLRECTIDQATELAQQVTESYLLQKRRKFFNAALTNEFSHAKLQRAFELPTAITRKLARLQALRSKSRHATFSAEFYNRDSLARVSLQDLDSTGDWHTSAAWLIERDDEYSELLEETIDGRVTLREYDKWLMDISAPSYHHAVRLSIAALAISQC